MHVIWYRSKAKLKGALATRGSYTPREPFIPPRFPPEIVEMIIAHLAYDIPTLKACVATCLSWYNVALPHLHYTLTIRDRPPTSSNPLLITLSSLHKLELLPFVKKVQFDNSESQKTRWIVPSIFDSRSMQYFRALENLQELAIAYLDFSKFPLGVGEHFEHFAPILRSVALVGPLGNRRQLLDFFRLFPKLDDIKICEFYPKGGRQEAFDGKLVAIRGGLRGHLCLKNFRDGGLLRDLIVAFGGMRFTSMRLESVVGVPLLLEACTNTLETVYIYPGSRFHPGKTIQVPRVPIPDAQTDVALSVQPQLFDFSHNTVLRSLEVRLSSAFPPSHHYERTIEALSTITSPVFSEVVIVIVSEEAGWWHKPLAEVLSEMYKTKEFKAVFRVQTPEELRVPALQRFTSSTRQAVEEGRYDFLPRPPVVHSRPVSSFDSFCQSLRVAA